MPTDITRYVDIEITRESVLSTGGDFGTAIWLSATATWAERVRSYTGTDGVLEDFAEGSPEALAAAAYFAQEPHPEEFKIGRITPWTLVYVISVVNIRNNNVYKAQVDGEGVTSTLAATAASDGSATNDEIVALLVTALNAVVGKNYTAVATGSVGSKVVTVTGTTAGDWFSIEVDPDLAIVCTAADPGVATDLDAILREDRDWYLVLNGAPSEAIIAAIRGWVESRICQFFADTNQTTAVTAAEGTGDAIDDLKTANATRTSGWYHPSPKNMLGSAIAGRYLGYKAGEATAAVKPLGGVETVDLTSDQRDNLEDKNGNSYELVAGGGATFDGKTGDGNFIDERHFLDWWKDDAQRSVFDLIRNQGKLPFTEAGITQVKGKLLGSVKRGIERTGIDGDAPFSVTFPKKSAIAQSDRKKRLLPDGLVTFELANAVQRVVVRAKISI